MTAPLIQSPRANSQSIQLFHLNIMRRAAAFLLFLTLLWQVGVTAAARPLSLGAETSHRRVARCRCCECGTGACCVARSTPSPAADSPAVPARASEEHLVALAAPTPERRSPATPSERPLPSVFLSSAVPAGAPLCVRFCCFLI